VPSHKSREALVQFAERFLPTPEDKEKFAKLLKTHEQTDANGLREDFLSLEEDAAEVVRQWEQGSVGMLDEACGKLRSNGRPGWWIKK